MSTSTSTALAVADTARDALVTATTLAETPDAEWVARLDALVSECAEQDNHDAALAVVGRIAEHGGTAHADEWRTVADTLAVAAERAEHSIRSALRAVWWAIHDHKRAEVDRITATEVAHALGVTEATLSRRIKGMRAEMVAALWRKHGVSVDVDDAALRDAVATLGKFRDAHDAALSGDGEPPVTPSDAEQITAPNPVESRRSDAERIAERITALLASAEDDAERKSLASLLRDTVTKSLRA